MPRKTVLLCLIERVTTEALLPLKVEDESPELSGPDLSYIGRQPFGAEEILEVSNTVGHDGYCFIAFALGLGIQPVPLDQSS